jgi:hypothetical protein
MNFNNTGNHFAISPPTPLSTMFTQNTVHKRQKLSLGKSRHNKTLRWSNCYQFVQPAETFACLDMRIYLSLPTHTSKCTGASAQFIFIRFKRCSLAIIAACIPLLFGAKGGFLRVADSVYHKCS